MDAKDVSGELRQIHFFKGELCPFCHNRLRALVSLRPCPSCGSAASHHLEEYNEWVWCAYCGMRGPYHDHDGAQWNAILREDP